MVAALRATYASGRTRPATWRIEQLRGIERLLDEREGEIAAALAEDLGRSAVEAWLIDISNPKVEAAYARKRVRRWMRRRPQPLPLNQLPALGWVQYEPLGVVLVIAPWNAPVVLALNPLVAALAAGNCAVVKPSELAPATSRLLARLIPTTSTTRQSWWSKATGARRRNSSPKGSITRSSPAAPKSARR
ncbi:aldehyde dehydrogenase family protein [Rhodococcus sp. MTM3W5.2]|nr:aldehyde dehydrogenase family protein [Rhodococcus sp. MTM3W5.2]